MIAKYDYIVRQSQKDTCVKSKAYDNVGASVANPPFLDPQSWEIVWFGLKWETNNSTVLGDLLCARLLEFANLPGVHLLEQPGITDHHFKPMVQFVNELEDVFSVCNEGVIDKRANNIGIPYHNAAVIAFSPLFIRHPICTQRRKCTVIRSYVIQASRNNSIKINV